MLFSYNWLCSKSLFDDLLGGSCVDGIPVVEGLTDILSFSGDARLSFGCSRKQSVRRLLPTLSP